MHARLDHRLAAPLDGEAGLDRGQYLVVGDGERLDIEPVEIGEIEGRRQIQPSADPTGFAGR
jgi:hypothetical protein